MIFIHIQIHNILLFVVWIYHHDRDIYINIKANINIITPLLYSRTHIQIHKQYTYTYECKLIRILLHYYIISSKSIFQNIVQ